MKRKREKKRRGRGRRRRREKGMNSSKELCMILYGIMCILDFGRVSKPRV